MPSAITRLSLALQQVTYPGYTFAIVGDSDTSSEVFYLRASFLAEDIKTKKVTRHNTRKWLLSQHMTNSELVQTALKCVLTSVEHEARENFRYMEEPIFAPHYDVDDLVVLCSQGGSTAGGRVDRRTSHADAAGFQR